MSSIKKKDLKYNLHSWSAQGKLDPIVITKAEGIYFLGRGRQTIR